MPALGKDLSTIRSHLGLSIQDIQYSTKIPVASLKSIENGTIFDHPEENQTYIRSFVRSYARALKIDDDVMIKALDQREAGNYTDLLLQEYPELIQTEPVSPVTENEPEEPQTDSFTETQEEFEGESTEEAESGESDETSETIENEEEEEQSSETEETEPVKTPEATETPKPTANITSPPKKETSPSVKSVDWANVGRKFSEEKKHTPVWIVALIIVLIIAAVAGYFLYQNDFFNFSERSSQDQELVEPDRQTSQDNVASGTDESLTPTGEVDETGLPVESAAELENVLQLTIYAAYDALGPVRVWSDVKPRMDPYWLEQGTAMQFDFQDTIRVRGSYANMLLFKDGNRIENVEQQFLQSEQDYIELTRGFFESDAKWATSIDYELPDEVPPPDSIASRPTF